MYGLSPVRFGGGVSMVTATLGVNDPSIGDVCYDASGINGSTAKYLFVYNAGNSQISPGFGAVMSGAVSGASVTVSSVTDVDFLAGVCRHATITTGAYGWLLTQGLTSVQMGANNSAAAGGYVSLGSDGNFAVRPASAATGLLMAAVAGKYQAAIASGASGNAWISVF